MRNWKNIDQYLTNLAQDVYPQADDEGHATLAKEIIDMCMADIKCKNVLDIGCGTAFCQPMFEDWGLEYEGIALGNDVAESQKFGRNVKEIDFHFLEYPDNSFDLLFARHVLEHSPMALLALMEWHRVSSHYLLLVLPNPNHYGYIGRNHYSVLPRPQAVWLLRRAGWRIIGKQYTETEYRFLCEKLPVISYEGYAETPLPYKIYEENRDG